MATKKLLEIDWVATLEELERDRDKWMLTAWVLFLLLILISFNHAVGVI